MATPGKNLDDRTKQTVKKMGEQKVPRAEIARALGIAVSSVGKILRNSR